MRAGLLLLLLLWAPVQARDLRALEAEMAAVQAWLQAAGKEQQTLQANLREAEKAVAQVLAEAETIAAELPGLERELRTLAKEQAQLAREHQAHRAQLAEHLRAAWALGDDDWLKVALNQQDPDDLQRMLAWHGYVNRARQEAIVQVQDSLQALDENRARLDRRQQQLADRRAALAREQERLAGLRRERAAVAEALRRDIATETQRQASLQADRVALEQAVAGVAAGVAAGQGKAGPFKAAKGQLPWPLTTRIRAQFNELRASGGRWQGLLLAAEEGDAVRAVHDGEVVFADWLRGFGLVLVLDHGDGYLSLYAHNQRLLAKAGDRVQRGATLALAGATGGLDTPGLYFEIRAKGAPVNPRQWLASR